MNWRRGWMAAAGLGLIVGISVIVAREPLLAAMGRWLVTETSVGSRADVVVALGGYRGRQEAAVALLNRGLARKLLIVGTDVQPRDYACMGVPMEKALLPVSEAYNTYDEAIAAREVMQQQGLRSAIVVTSPYHLRRTRWSFAHVFQGSGIELAYAAVPRDLFPMDAWWKSEIGRKLVLIEYLGMAYYWFTAWGEPVRPSMGRRTSRGDMVCVGGGREITVG